MRGVAENENEGFEQFLRVSATILYALSTASLAFAFFFIYSSLGDLQHSGDAIALAILVYWFLLPISVMAILVTIKMSRLRWPKALIAFGLWVANVIASFAY